MDLLILLPSGKKVRSMSGCIEFICSLNALESRANIALSTNCLICFLSFSSSIDVIIYFKRVDNSGLLSLLILERPSNSRWIFFSSWPSNSLNVILVLVKGKVKGNSLTPAVNNDSSIILLSIVDKSILCTLSNEKNSYSLP